jgi:two-component system sensor histidine kinase QseC
MNFIKASSLRIRLLVGLMLAIVGFTVVWFACQAMLVSSQHTGRWDASMQAVGQQVLLSMPAVLPSGSSEPAYDLPSQSRLQPQLMSYQVWLRTGRSVLRSTGSPTQPLVPLRFDEAEGFHMATIDGVDWRVYTLNDASGQIQVQIGKSQPQLLSLLMLWLGTSVGTVLLLMALLGVVTWLIICWSLAPVEAARAAMLERGPLDLQPLSAHALPSEVKPLVESFNALLLRLEAALQGERRFLADAAHELRTPLAALMAQAQLVQSAPTLEDSRASLSPLISGIERSARLTEQLLDLARLDAVASPTAQPAVQLHEIVSLVVRDYDNTAQSGNQRLLLHAEPCSARVDVDAVGVLLRNLLDNALRYAGPGARVEIMCREQAGLGVLLSVRDDGPGVPEAERERIFDRFYRVPGTPGRGSGIGLSLVARIAKLHAATLEVCEGLDGRGLGITLRFMCSEPSPVIPTKAGIQHAGMATGIAGRYEGGHP